MRRKKERSKQGQTNKQGKTTQHTQGSGKTASDGTRTHDTLYYRQSALPVRVHCTYVRIQKIVICTIHKSDIVILPYGVKVRRRMCRYECVCASVCMPSCMHVCNACIHAEDNLSIPLSMKTPLEIIVILPYSVEVGARVDMNVCVQRMQNIIYQFLYP